MKELTHFIIIKTYICSSPNFFSDAALAHIGPTVQFQGRSDRGY